VFERRPALPKELLCLLEEAADERSLLCPPGSPTVYKSLTAFFDNMEAAERAAYDLGQRFGGVRAHVYSARAAESGLPALTLPVEDFAALTEGIQSDEGVVWAELPGSRLRAAAGCLRASGAVGLAARRAARRQDGRAG
jgi:hypothetical protein